MFQNTIVRLANRTGAIPLLPILRKKLRRLPVWKLNRFKKLVNGILQYVKYRIKNEQFQMCHFIGLSPSGKAQDFDSCIRWFESN